MEESFVYHLEELRARIIRIILYLIVFSLFSFIFSLKIIEFIKKPVGELYFFSPQEAFFVRIKVSLLSGIILAFPFVIREIWAFVKPGLYEKEIKILRPFIIFSPLLFYTGFLFAFFLLYPLGVKVLLSFAGKSMKPIIHISEIVNLLFYLTLFTGILFELPIIVLLLLKLDLIDLAFLKKKRKEFIVIIFIISAILTPSTDFLTMSMLALPLIILYELTILIAKGVKK